MRPTGFRHAIRSRLVRLSRRIKRSMNDFSVAARDLRNYIFVIIIQWFPRHWRSHRFFRPFWGWYLTQNHSPHQFVGRCIYCGSTDQLSDEHIVPAGLGGDQILYKASCESCRLKIKVIEDSCLGEMKAIRYRRGIGLRRVKMRPDTLTLWVLTNWDGKQEVLPPGQNPAQKWEKKEVPYAEHMTSFFLPVFKRPGIMRGLIPGL
jgi:hypothetical protein